ncbi:chaperone TorD involved in molybdoenzyme TorA maturation [Salinihabitans flavidus]|uniref:Chaperone TorD involved in molybdoenzyme TorA maturation n=1 Tax=Salinihabitans flavidus TaxID=569882 RepID=A0A1H8PSA9_9RHOB|nr:molecular chaperone TorD family protein [Salinihabitans flavidus]SEO44889.1 chaperone TorD involved in molybdoenzyme TorA maturation [Salinihabitans flavidus]
MSEAARIDPAAIAEEDRLRAELYDFLAALLARPPSQALLDQCARLSGDGSQLGQSVSVLANLAGKTTQKKATREFNDLFIGLGRGELLPYASFYMTGFLHEKPLAVLRRDMAERQIERAPNVYEPEDNIAGLMEMMAGLIEGRFGAPASLGSQQTFFNRHIAPWAPHFFSDLEGAKTSVFYAPVGTVGRIFMGIEREAFRMGAG